MKNISILYGLIIVLFTVTVSLGQQDKERAKYQSIAVTAGTGTDKDLEQIRVRVLDELFRPPVNDQHIASLIRTFQTDRTWPGINYTDVSRTGFQMIAHLNNVYDMARAFRKPGSAYFEKAVLLSVISNALDYWLEKDFICDNWWWNEMGTPNTMGRLLLILDDKLTPEQKEKGLYIAGRANLKASGARPGGDLIQIASMRGNQALLQRNSEELGSLIATMVSEIKITPDDRGLKPDMSFHHRVDKVISTLSYGTGYASSFADWAVKVRGTRYAFPDSSTRLLIDYFLEGIASSMVYGTFPDPGAKNRGISRRGALNPTGPSLPANLMLVSDYRKEELAEIVRLRKGGKNPDLSGNHFYWYSEYFSHQRPSYFTSVRMHSDRNNTMEQPHNEEGLKNHHYGDGSNFISRTGREYSEIFPVWDWQKIPGTTIVQKPALPHWKEIAKKGKSHFVGGASDGQYGAVGFDFTSVHDSLKARKSWFFFDNEIVCLGADINASGGFPVLTTANQSLLHGDVTIHDSKGIRKLKINEELESEVQWINHDSISYIFSGNQKISVSNQTQSGSWRSITHQAWATDEPVSKALFTATISHGTNPLNAGYSYVILPGLTPEKTQHYDLKKHIAILSNTGKLQAVKQLEKHLVQAVFYEPGSLSLTSGLDLNVSQPCIMLIQMKGNNVTKITLTDPTHDLKNIEVTLHENIKQKGNVSKKPIQVDLPQGAMAGSSISLSIP